MYDHILIRYGEISLKGKNQMRFVKRLANNIKFAIRRKHGDDAYVRYEKGRIFINLKGEAPDKYYPELKKVFGILSFSPVIKTGTEIEEIEATIKSEIESLDFSPKTFRSSVKRSNKRYPIKSPELQKMFGGFILRNFEEIKVDLHNPDVDVNVEIREDCAYVYTKKIQGLGGLPVKISSKGMILLSGGIDSPVAGVLAMKRGLEVEGVHFHSYPYTSERAKQKVLDLARIMSEYTDQINLHVVSFTKIQEEIAKNCDERYWITIMRRFMLRISEELAKLNNCKALITGESIGQVASQTLESMNAINDVVNMPVIRPLVTMDKEEIIQIAKRIDTFEKSIEPYEDCCTAFLPKEPKTKPKISDCEKNEEKLDIEGLVKDAIENTEMIKITPKKEDEFNIF